MTPIPFTDWPPGQVRRAEIVLVRADGVRTLRPVSVSEMRLSRFTLHHDTAIIPPYADGLEQRDIVSEHSHPGDLFNAHSQERAALGNV